MRTLAGIGIGMLLLASCSDNKDFSEKYAEALCSKNWECCGATELSGKTKAECVMNNQFAVSTLVGEINASQSKGRAAYDAGKANACADEMKAMTCDQFKQGGSNMATCMAFVTPKVAAGGACTQDYECTTGNCEGADTVSDPPVDGMCAGAISLAPIGAACANIECVDGAYCDSATSTCQASKGAGQTCTSDTECNNECDTATGTCTCYSGCNVAGPTPPRGVLLSLLVLGAVLVLRRSRRRRPNG